MYAIVRTEKLKSQGEVSGSSMHATRERETPNADASRSHLNEVLLGASDPATEIERRISEWESRTGYRVRSNAVRGIEVFMSASPEFFQEHPERMREFFSRSIDWAKDHFGEKNLVSVISHQDESTPHLTAYVVPFDSEKNVAEGKRQRGPTERLNAGRWLDGKEKMAAIQTSFAHRMAPLGLERGVEGSKAEHTEVKKWYGVIKQCKSMTGIDDDLRAVQQVMAAKKKMSEEMTGKLAEVEAYLIAKKKRIEDAKKKMNDDLARAKAKPGEFFQGIVSDPVLIHGKKYIPIINGVSEKLLPFDGNIMSLLGKQVEVVISQTSNVSITESRVSNMYSKDNKGMGR